MKRYLFAAVFLLLAACTTSGPEEALNEVADAMEQRNGQAFLAHIDMSAFATHHIENMTQDNDALNSINAIGKMFGLGGIDDLIGSVVDMQARLSKEMNRGVSSGEMMAECRKSETPNCPWVPQALRNARIVELGADSAIAQVTTPTSLTSWLALRKINNRWLIVGQAVLESTARAYATSPVQPAIPAPQGVQKI